jgi:hypothetical protein
MDWKDNTSYSRGDKVREPGVLAVVDDPLRLKVHRWHGIENTWFASCDLFERRELKATELDAAKVEAVDMLVGALRQALYFYAD